MKHVFVLFSGPFGYDDAEKIKGVYRSLAGAQKGLEGYKGEWWHSTDEPENWYGIDPKLPEKEQMLPYRIQRFEVKE